MSKPLVITVYSLTRVLKDFGLRMGLSDTFADVLAQVYLQDSPIAERWTDFIAENCANCSLDPGTCMFLNPGHETIRGTATIASTKAAVAIMIENGKLKSCPARKQVSE